MRRTKEHGITILPCVWSRTMSVYALLRSWQASIKQKTEIPFCSIWLRKHISRNCCWYFKSSVNNFIVGMVPSNCSSKVLLEIVKSHSVLHLWSNSDTSNIPYLLLFLIPITFQFLSSFQFCDLPLSSHPLCPVSVHPCLFVSVWPFPISMRLIIM